MTLEVLQQEMVEAMKNGEKARKDAISSMIGQAKNLAIAKGQKDNISEAIVDEAILKERKVVEEQIATCPQDRDGLLKSYYARLLVISEFAPKMMSREEIMETIQRDFSEVIAGGNKGKAMKEVMAVLKGRADGKMINECVTELIAGSCK